MSVMQNYIDAAAKQPPAPVVRTYTEEEGRAGIMALVVSAGSPKRAAEVLKTQGIDIPASTLSSWKSQREEEYTALREEWAPKLEQEMVRQYRETAIYAGEVERKAIEAAEKRLDEGKDVNPHQTATAMAKVRSSATEKLLVLTGRPQSITEHRSVEELTRALVGLGVIELVDAEVVDDPKELPLATQQDAA